MLYSKNKYQKIHGKWKRNQTPNWAVKDWEKYFEFKNIKISFKNLLNFIVLPVGEIKAR